MKAFMELQHGSESLGVLTLELYNDSVPKTVRNFVGLFPKYKHSTFHRIIKGFMAQGGDFTNHDGTGGHSIYNNHSVFDDETFLHKHSQPGVLSMANAGPHTNGSQFFITFDAAPSLDGKHVVFGQVQLPECGPLLQSLQAVATNTTTTSDHRPIVPVTIANIGLINDSGNNTGNNNGKEEERVLSVVEATKTSDATTNVTVPEANEESPMDKQQQQEDDEDDDIDADQPLISKAQNMKERLRQLKKKMNQARQLNRVAVQEEGVHLTRTDREEQSHQARLRKQAQVQQWTSSHARAVELGNKAGIHPKFIAQPAEESLYQARLQEDAQEMAQYSVKDYHNPQGQHRNYMRSIRGLKGSRRSDTASKNGTDNSSATYNPMDGAATQTEREGARKVAHELHRRYENATKRDLKRKAQHNDDEAGGINLRNKRFNEKISRNYDQATAEIRQNLERGTAL